MTNLKYLLYLLVFVFFINNSNASTDIKLNEIKINVQDEKSLQRGARIFFDNCQGCHSLKYMRYYDLAVGIKINQETFESTEKLIKKYFMHSIEGINEHNPILNSISKEMGIKWFGKIPPDLSLISRYRGPNWIYTYMKSFYKDDSRPWGVNNLIFPDVGMPHVLLKYQGIQIINKDKSSNNILELIEDGTLSKEEYDNMVYDLVNFLSYVGEPGQADRTQIGMFIIIFLLILTYFLYKLKKEYWKNIK
jgi:ubiquinol-cytochrome c reductase cytochrome c1 subunit